MNLQGMDVQQLIGQPVVTRDGDKLGKADDIYLDQDTRVPEWVLVNMGMFGSRQSFVPLAQAEVRGDELVVPYDKATVKDAPHAEPDGDLSQEEEARLYEHYGLSYSDAPSDSGLPTGGKAQQKGRSTDDAMTRSEEELDVQKVRRPSELVRLKKYIVTENVTKTVPVQREEVRIEREPVTDANVDEALRGPDLTESDHEVTLNEEEVVVEKRVVPKERVRLEKDVTTEEKTVSEEVRKEQIEVERGKQPKDKR